jgi:Transmembrane protein 131-like N-terminal
LYSTSSTCPWGQPPAKGHLYYYCTGGQVACRSRGKIYLLHLHLKGSSPPCVFVPAGPRVLVCFLPARVPEHCALYFGQLFGAKRYGAARRGTQGVLTIYPGNLDFQTVVVGKTATQWFEIKNSGSTRLYLFRVFCSKGEFALAGPRLPLALAPGRRVWFRMTFHPESAAKISALLEIESSGPALISYTLTGAGEAPYVAVQLTPASLDFGSQKLDTSAARNVTVQNSGDVGLIISGVTVIGSGFSYSNVAAGMWLAPRQQATLQISFLPRSSGVASGQVSILSRTLASAATLPLAGIGVSPSPPPPPPAPPPTPTPTTPAPPAPGLPPPGSSPPAGQHVVHLTWAASSTAVVGYIVHRGTMSGGPYPDSTASPVPTVSYDDTSVVTGGTYYYVVTSVDANGAESAYSNQASASVFDTVASSQDTDGTSIGTSIGTATDPGSSTSVSPSPPASPPTSPPANSPTTPTRAKTAVHLAWQASENGAIGYRVYRGKTNGGPYMTFSNGLVDSLSFDDDTVDAGTTYYYVVTALDADGNESSYSNQAIAVIAGP